MVRWENKRNILPVLMVSLGNSQTEATFILKIELRLNLLTVLRKQKSGGGILSDPGHIFMSSQMHFSLIQPIYLSNCVSA